MWTDLVHQVSFIHPSLDGGLYQLLLFSLTPSLVRSFLHTPASESIPSHAAHDDPGPSIPSLPMTRRRCNPAHPPTPQFRSSASLLSKAPQSLYSFNPSPTYRPSSCLCHIQGVQFLARYPPPLASLCLTDVDLEKRRLDLRGSTCNRLMSWSNRFDLASSQLSP